MEYTQQLTARDNLYFLKSHTKVALHDIQEARVALQIIKTDPRFRLSGEDKAEVQKLVDEIKNHIAYVERQIK